MRDYFQIFSDTLIAHILPPFQKTSKRKPVATEKFYFFDLGVARSLARAGEISAETSAFGKALEHLILLDLISYKDYNWIPNIPTMDNFLVLSQPSNLQANPTDSSAAPDGLWMEYAGQLIEWIPSHLAAAAER